jgi:hypothetical protein
MPTGYQSRLSDTYWTSPTLTWGGGMWSGPGSEFTLEPTAAMDMNFIELRMVLKFFGFAGVGVKLVQRYIGAVLQDVYVLSGQQDQRVCLRLHAFSSTDINLVFNMSVDIEIYEIDVGYIGMHV